jgi:hypothetical protein
MSPACIDKVRGYYPAAAAVCAVPQLRSTVTFKEWLLPEGFAPELCASAELFGCLCSVRLHVQVLDAYTPALHLASPSDTALLLVTVARLQHVSSYSWLQGVLDHCQDNMMTFDGQVSGCVCGCAFSIGLLHPPEHLLLYLAADTAF